MKRVVQPSAGYIQYVSAAFKIAFGLAP